MLSAFNEPYVFKDDLPIPKDIPKEDILVRVLAASYCHTDTVYSTGVMPPATLPRVGCHEFAGEIVAHGADVPPSLRETLKVGTKVGVPVRSYHPCGRCLECLNSEDDDVQGYSVICPKAHRLGISIDGGFQDYVCVDARQVEVIPDPLTALETAPLMCAGLTIFAALQRIQLECRQRRRPCDKIAIIGAGGGLGHLGVQFAVKMGFSSIIATDASDGAMQVIHRVSDGFTSSEKEKLIVVDARNTDPAELLKTYFLHEDASLAGENGVDAAIVLPETQKSFDYSMKLLRRHGTCCIVSFPSGFQMDPNDLIFRDIKIIGSLIGTRKQMREMMRLAADTGVRAQTKTFALEDLNKLVQEYHKGNGGKLVIDMTLTKD